MSILDALDRSFAQDSGSQGSSTQAPVAGGSKDGGTLYQALLEARARQMQDLQEKQQGVHDLDDTAEGGLLGPPDVMRGSAGTRSVPGGFGLRYDDESEIQSIDVAGPGQQERLAEFVSREIDNNSQGLDVAASMKVLGLQSAQHILPGLEFRLLGHQSIGVAWMIKMETEQNWKGGILADDMGLGKTVQMIALMSKNMPGPNDEDKTTLIVVPAALMQQWKEEIETKSNQLFSVHIHHGKDKLKKISQVRRKDVVITSYQTLCMDYSVPDDVEDGYQAEWLAENGGVLARTRFYRVIADEAQFIRNRRTRASISMAHVRAQYRWMLTGTPVTNTLADLYGLMRFGRFAPWNDWCSFNEHIARVQMDDPPLAGQRAQVILKPLLLRRTKNSNLEGKPILQLPPKDIELVRLQFSAEEREVYDDVEKKAKIRINKFIKDGTLVKNHHFVLVMILRLRQVCCHPNLILSKSGEYDSPGALMGTDTEKELARARKSMGIPWVTSVKHRFLLRAAAERNMGMGGDGASASCCPVCEEAYTDDTANIFSCGHEMCSECISNTRNSAIAHDGIFDGDLQAEKAFEEAEAKGHRPCPTCKKMIDMADNKIFKSVAFEPSEEELDHHSRSKRREQWNSKRSPSPDVKMRGAPSRSDSIIELSDSDDDLPDCVLKKKPAPAPSKKGKNRVVMSSDDDSSDESPFLKKNQPTKKAQKGKSSKFKASVKGSGDESDSDIEFLGMSPSKRKAEPQSSASSSNGKGKGKEKEKRKVVDDSDSDIEYMGMSPSKRKAGGKQGSRKRARDTPDSDEDETKHAKHDPSKATLAIWSRGDDDMEPSAKMKALLNYISEWESTGDKIIVYSQWTAMLDLLDILLVRHGLRNLRFDGKMDRVARDRTVATFKQRGGPKILLISTKCGSVGLNLVAANRVVNMDLSWNYASESQAYDRVHRIGQDKDVFVKRLVVENTIEERMLKLQDVKTGLAEAALGEGAGGKLNKMSVKDIQYLFGMSGPPKPNGG